MKKGEQNRNLFGEEFISPPISIADQVYAYLKEKILFGEIKPGERLKQVPVAKIVKISCWRLINLFIYLFIYSYPEPRALFWPRFPQ